MGKTTAVVDLINKHLRNKVVRSIALCPTFIIQKTFDPVRDMFQKRDIHTNPTQQTLKMLLKDIVSTAHASAKKGLPPPPTLVFIDDLAGSSLIHTNRKGAFANFSVQVPHWNVIAIVLTQQPTSVDPNFRDNCENVLSFYSEREEDFNYLKKNHGRVLKCDYNFADVVNFAWTDGGQEEEVGQHFLFVHSPPRAKTEYFVDWKCRIII